MKYLKLVLAILVLGLVAEAQTPVKWPIQKNWQANSGLNDRTAITYPSTGSRVVAVSYGTGGVDVVSRHALAGNGSFSFKLVFSSGVNNVAVGLDTSPIPVSAGLWDYYLSSTTNVNQSGVFVFDASPVTTSQVFTFELTGTTVVLKKNGVTIHTFTSPATLPLYLHINSADTGTGLAEVNYTGTTVSEPAAPSAPTCTATNGHKRNHIQVTYPASANGVSIFRSTSSNGQDFDEPIVTEWRLPYYEDTGLTNGTTYYYKCRATINGLSESANSSETSATPTLNQLPSYSADVALIVGSPAVYPIGDTPQNYWVDRLNEEQLIYWGMVAPKKIETASISGTVTATNGSKTITGSGTTFLADYRNDGFIKITDSGGTERLYRIYFIYSDTSLELWDAYEGATQSGRSHRPWWQALQNDGYFLGYLHYYDLSLNIYHAYLATGAPYLLQLFRENADAMYEMAIAMKAINGDMFTSPRQMALGGIILRALDAKPEYWTNLIDDAIDEAYQIWIQNRITPGQYFDNVRDASYVLQYTAMSGKANPDSTIRTTNTTKALNGVLNLFEWQMNKYTDHQPRYDYIEHDIDRDYNYHQPFINAIMGEMYIMVHKLTGNTTVRNGFLSWISNTGPQYTTNPSSNPAVNTRCVFYQLSNKKEPIASNPVPDAPDYSPPYDTLPPNQTGYDISSLPDCRFQNNIIISNFGYAYFLTRDVAYKTRADEMLNASYGDSTGVFSDGVSSISTVKFTGKNVNESFRRVRNYYAYRYVISGSVTTMRGRIRMQGQINIR